MDQKGEIRRSDAVSGFAWGSLRPVLTQARKFPLAIRLGVILKETFIQLRCPYPAQRRVIGLPDCHVLRRGGCLPCHGT